MLYVVSMLVVIDIIPFDYIVSQCQAIHARSIFPCQDTPDVKSTFDFNITSPLPVIASGLHVGKSASAARPGHHLYQFHQKVPIPSYLFALASGLVFIPSTCMTSKNKALTSTVETL